jgi:type I restriction enzyme S subunit
MSVMTTKAVKLADCVTLFKGKPPAEMPYFGGDAESYLSPEYLRGKTIAEPAKAAANAVRVQDGDTVLLWDGSNAGEFFRGRAGILASTMTHVCHGEEFSREYFYYAVKRWEHYLKGQTSGSGIPHVDKEVFESLEILYTELDKQRLIAHILSTLDKAIEQTEALIAKQQRIKTGLMQDLLTKGIDEHGAIRSEATHEFKDSPLGRIPVEWDVSPISKFSPPNRPYLRTGPFGSALNTKHWAEDGVPVITIGSLGDGEIIKAELLYVSEQTAEALKNYRVVQGDIVFSRVADIGRALVINEEQVDWIISSNFMRISINNAQASPKYLYRNIVFNDAVHAQLRRSSNSGGRDVVNGAIISSLLFPWPSLEEQNRINARIGDVDKTIALSSKQLRKLLSIKQGLMNDLLTGKVRVTELLNPEPSPS